MTSTGNAHHARVFETIPRCFAMDYGSLEKEEPTCTCSSQFGYNWLNNLLLTLSNIKVNMNFFFKKR